MSTPFKLLPDGRSEISSVISTEDLRFHLLYWDKIDVPVNTAMWLGIGGAEIDYLVECGVLIRTEIKIASFRGAPAVLMAIAQLEALKKHDLTEPGKWSVSQVSNVRLVPEGYRLNTHSISIDLHKLLPVPGPDTPLEDILKFKEVRSPELAALRVALDGLCLEVGNSVDFIRAENYVKDKLQAALNDLNRVSSESFLMRLFGSFKIDINPATILTTAGATATALMPLGVPIVWGGAIGAVGAMVKFEISNSASARRDCPLARDLLYVSQVRENFPEPG